MFIVSACYNRKPIIYSDVRFNGINIHTMFYLVVTELRDVKRFVELRDVKRLAELRNVKRLAELRDVKRLDLCNQ